MGREVKRVPLDFSWPLNKVWEGFINPHYKNCESCDGSGATTASQRLGDLVGLLMLSSGDYLSKRAHPYFSEAPLHNTQGIVCSADIVELTEGLAGRKAGCGMLGHDACDNWSAQKKIIAAAGLPEDWGTCKICEGEGMDSALKEAYEAWSATEPPKGDAYQVWETVSEGSPISPPFMDPMELAIWMEANPRGVDKGTSRNAWFKFITGPGWAPSFIGTSRGLETGVQAGENA